MVGAVWKRAAEITAAGEEWEAVYGGDDKQVSCKKYLVGDIFAGKVVHRAFNGAAVRGVAAGVPWGESWEVVNIDEVRKARELGWGGVVTSFCCDC